METGSSGRYFVESCQKLLSLEFWGVSLLADINALNKEESQESKFLMQWYGNAVKKCLILAVVYVGCFLFCPLQSKIV